MRFNEAFRVVSDTEAVLLLSVGPEGQLGFPGGTRPGFPSLGQEDPLQKEWQPTPVFLPGKSHGQRSLEGCIPQGHRELDTTEHVHTRTVTYPL